MPLNSELEAVGSAQRLIDMGIAEYRTVSRRIRSSAPGIADLLLEKQRLLLQQQGDKLLQLDVITRNLHSSEICLKHYSGFFGGWKWSSRSSGGSAILLQKNSSRAGGSSSVRDGPKGRGEKRLLLFKKGIGATNLDGQRTVRRARPWISQGRGGPESFQDVGRLPYGPSSGALIEGRGLAVRYLEDADSRRENDRLAGEAGFVAGDHGEEKQSGANVSTFQSGTGFSTANYSPRSPFSTFAVYFLSFQEWLDRFARSCWENSALALGAEKILFLYCMRLDEEDMVSEIAKENRNLVMYMIVRYKS